MQRTLSRCECNGLWQWTRRYQIPPTVRCEAWFGFCRRKTLDPVKFTDGLLQSIANMLWTRLVSENGARYLRMGEQMFMTLTDQGDPLSSQTHWSKRWTASFERIDISQLAKHTNNVRKCLVQLCTKGPRIKERYWETCTRKKEIGHLCYMQPLRNELPSCDEVLYVFYDFEMFRIWYVYTSSFRDVRARKISSKNTCSVVRGNIRSGRIR